MVLMRNAVRKVVSSMLKNPESIHKDTHLSQGSPEYTTLEVLVEHVQVVTEEFHLQQATKHDRTSFDS